MTKKSMWYLEFLEGSLDLNNPLRDTVAIKHTKIPMLEVRFGECTGSLEIAYRVKTLLDKITQECEEKINQIDKDTNLG